MSNRLLGTASPYLLQHAHNPVDWRPWDPDALDEARRLNRPILLSVGYSACHWCHVMERESFSDPETAALMNRNFVCIKVDREERPDIDAVYMAATQAMTGRGGWPMTVFLTPDGHPFFAGAYFPPEDRYGMPGFRRVLASIADSWRERPAAISGQAATIAGDLERFLSRTAEPGTISDEDLHRAVGVLNGFVDARHGGFGGAPKFPQPMVLDFLLSHAQRTGSMSAAIMADRALAGMAYGGIRDHLGGGFHRYSVDAEWRVPHFEKMLYDNAQLAAVYLHAWRTTGRGEWRQVGEETLDFVIRELASPEGAFCAALDADSSGEEGLFYTWTPEEIEAVLGRPQADEVCHRFGVTAHGEVEGRSVLVNTPCEPIGPEMAQTMERLREARDRRVRPARDDKVVLAWNAMTLAAFAEAAMLTGRSDYLRTAVRNADVLLRKLVEEGTGGRLRLIHSGIDEPSGSDVHGPSAFRRSGIRGFLEDYALLGDALVTLHGATAEGRYLQTALRIADEIPLLFGDFDGLGAMTATESADLFTGAVPREDNATPSGNAAAAGLYCRLAALPVPNAERYQDRAARALSAMAREIVASPIAYGRWLGVAELLVGGATSVIIADGVDAPGASALYETARRRWRRGWTIASAVSLDSAEFRPVEGRAAAYVCRDRRCRTPVTEPAELERILQE